MNKTVNQMEMTADAATLDMIRSEVRRLMEELKREDRNE